MLLINCEFNFILTWSENSVIIDVTGTGTLKITDTKLYVSFVILSTRDQDSNAQLIAININKKYQRTYKTNI